MSDNHKNIVEMPSKRDEFATNITHELKTPLTSIIGFIELLKKGGGKDQKTRDYCYDVIDSEAQRLLHLIDDVLLLSQLGNLAKSPLTQRCSIKKEIQTCMKHLLPLAEQKNIDITENIDDDLFVTASSTRLQQLFSNIIGNAVKYNVPGGKIFVDSHLQQDSKDGAKKVMTKIRDTGIGIAPEHIDKIFNRFYRVKNQKTEKISGNGLGLSIVKDIVTLYGGDIQVHSKLGEGSEFTISFDFAAN